MPDGSEWRWLVTNIVKNEQFHNICPGTREEFGSLSFESGSIQVDFKGNNSLKFTHLFSSVRNSPLSLIYPWTKEA